MARKPQHEVEFAPRMSEDAEWAARERRDFISIILKMLENKASKEDLKLVMDLLDKQKQNSVSKGDYQLLLQMLKNYEHTVEAKHDQHIGDLNVRISELENSLVLATNLAANNKIKMEELLIKLDADNVLQNAAVTGSQLDIDYESTIKLKL